MQTALGIRFKELLKKLDTRKSIVSYEPTMRELALMATFWEQITPTFEEYGKLRKQCEQLDLQLRRHVTEHTHGFTPGKESGR